jgi:spore coat protein CotH
MTSTAPSFPRPPRRRWWRRLMPARVRLHARLLLGSLLVAALAGLVLGSFQIRPIVFSTDLVEPPEITYSVPGSVDLFDRTQAHSIELDISDVEYRKLMNDFQRDGDKTWIEANAVIDGTTVESVGIRLKGNSTLMSLRGGQAGRPGMPGGFTPPGGSGGPPAGAPPDGAPPDGAPPSGSPMGEGQAGPPRGGAMSTASFADPSSLPLLLSFDHFIEGRGYQGRAELAIRPITGAGTNLNEALALDLIAASGQPSQRFTWVSFRLNGGEPTTRLVLENPDQNYAASLGFGTGVLYKSRSTNTFTYHGEDHTQYVTDFDQVSARGNLDMAPIIHLLGFLEQADDARFDAELASWVDVASFSRYVATHDLLNNFDDMSGPGRNFLLWYDVGDRRFQVITWDMNLAISGMGGMGARGGPGAPGAPPGAAPSAEAPRGMRGRPPGTEGGAGMPRMRMGNALKERFVASAAFADERAAARAELAALWFESGLAAERLRELAAAVPTSAKLSADTIASEAESLATQLSQLAAKSSATADPG